MKFQITIITLLQLCNSIRAIIENTTVLMGTIAEPLSELRFIRGKLVMDIDLTPHDDMRKIVANQLTSLETLRKHSVQVRNPVKGTELINLVSPLYTNTKKHIELAVAKLSKLMNTDWFKSLDKSNRTRRGLINVGGELLKTLFGTATDKELKEIKRKVNVFDSGYNGILTDIRTDHRLIEINTANLKLFAKEVTRIDNAWTAIMFLMQTDSLLVAVDRFADNLINIHKLIIDVSITHSPTDLSSKLLPFIPYDTFVEYDKTILHDYNYYSAIPLSEDTFDEYLSQATVFTHSNDYTIRLVIPYVSKDSYQLWKLHPFPTKMENENHRKILLLSDPYVLVSSDLQIITPLAPDSLRYCSQPKFDLHVCLPIINIGLTNHTNCPQTLLRQEKVLKCSLRDYVNKDPVLKWIQNTRYLSLNEPQEAVMICHGKVPQEVSLKFMNEINARCSIKSQNLNIPSVSVLHEEFSYELKVINISNPTWDPPNLEMEPIPKMQWIPPHWMNLTRTSEMRVRDTTIIGVLTVLSFAILIIILCMIKNGYSPCRKCTKRRNYDVEQPRYDTLSPRTTPMINISNISPRLEPIREAVDETDSYEN